MPVGPELLSMMTQIFEWSKLSGRDAWQNPTYAFEQEVIGYLDDSVHEVVDANGTKSTAVGAVYLADVYGIRVEDELRWCDEPVGQIIKVEDFRDENGPYASVVHYG